MKKFLFLSSLCLLFSACGNDGGEKGGTPSLKVEPSKLEFAAVAAPSQHIVVTAVGVEWDVRVSESASAWLKADKTDAKTVTVSVVDNATPEERSGSVTIVSNHEDVKSKSVTVVQTGGEEAYAFELDPVSLNFDAEGAASQTIRVTAAGGVMWTASVEEAAASWLTITEGEGTISVSVTDNQVAQERVGTVVVTPSVESLGKKAVRVTQAGKDFLPSLSVDLEDPETGLRFKANGESENAVKTIRVTAVKTDWTARAVDAAGNAASWFKAVVNKEDGLSKVDVDVTMNETLEERVGYVVIKATEEEVPEVRVTITQVGQKPYYSTLTENVTLDELEKVVVATINPTQAWDPEMGASWVLGFGTAGIEKNVDPQMPCAGTGIYLALEMRSGPVPFNDDNEYYMTEGVYNVRQFVLEGDSMFVSGGMSGYYDWQHPGSWVFVMENDVIKEKAPLAAGTITVSRSGEQYTFVFDCRDDSEYTVTGTASLEFLPRATSRPTDPVPTDPAAVM